MITAIREVRRARGLTLDEVARRCIPPSTAQTVSRLETGTRTVSVGWLNRLAAALEVSAADLVALPSRAELPVVAVLGPKGAEAPRRSLALVAPAAPAGGIAVVVAGGVGDYRAGDELWCLPIAPDLYAAAVGRDVLVPQPAGRFVFGRLIGRDDDGAGAGRLRLLPATPGGRERVIADPPWIAQAVRLVRSL
ncbi:MAG: helix-turn-helix domain-containing protein [Janthinobacterium lividum]